MEAPINQPDQHRLIVDVIIRDDYRVGFEQVGECTFVHVNVLRWNKRAARQFRDDIDDAHRLLGKPVYTLRRPEEANQPKFLALHGFHPCGHARDASGRLVEVFERSLDGQSIRRWHDVIQPDL
jgi:hypothetical protein